MVSTMTSLLAALYFFALVGRFDDSPDNTMFRSYDGVVALALTVAFCVVAIHTTTVYAKNVVADYVGNRRFQLYGYPGGREPLFFAKNLAFTIAVLTASMTGLTIAFTVFFITEHFTPLVASTDSALLASLPLLGSVMLLTLGATLIAGTIGVRQRSTITAIVAVIILIALLGNGIAISLTTSPLISWGIGITSIIGAACLIATTGRRIRTDDLM